MMAGLEIKVLEPLFTKVRFWVGVPPPSPLPLVECLHQKQKVLSGVSGLCGLNGTALPEPNLFGQF